MNHRAVGLPPTRLRHRNIYLIAGRVSKDDIQRHHFLFRDTCPAGAACVCSHQPVTRLDGKKKCISDPADRAGADDNRLNIRA